MPQQSASRPRILILGGSYGGLSACVNILNLSKGNKQLPSPIPIGGEPFKVLQNLQPSITILDERDGFFHTMGAPLAHTSSGFTSEAWRKFSSIKLLSQGGVKCVQGTATKLNMDTKVASYIPHAQESLELELEYDYLVVATGMKRAFPIVPKALEKDSYLEDARMHIAGLDQAETVVIIGGGAVGVEVAGEIKLHFPTKKIVLVHSHSQLLNAEPLPAAFKEKTFEFLRAMGVEVVLGKRVIAERNGDDEIGGDRVHAVLSDGHIIRCGKVISTISSHTPNTNFLPPAVLAEKGFVPVKDTLQFDLSHKNSEAHFAVGDIALWSGIKRVGNAFIMGQFAATNIVSLMLRDFAEESTSRALLRNPPFDPMMALTIGNNVVAYRPGSEVQSGGEESREALVGRGLGIDVCTKYLCLNDEDSFL